MKPDIRPVRASAAAALVALAALAGCTAGRTSAATTSSPSSGHASVADPSPVGPSTAAPSTSPSAAASAAGVVSPTARPSSPTVSPTVSSQAAAHRLTALARSAAGRSWSGTYRLVEHGEPPVAVTVRWTPRAYSVALAGAGRTSVFVATPAGAWSCDQSSGHQQCVRVAAAGQQVPAQLDPGLEHVFQALAELAAHPAAYSVGSAGTGCFAVRHNTSAGGSAVADGTYCWDSHGLLRRYDAASGTLTRVSVGAVPAASSIGTPVPP